MSTIDLRESVIPQQRTRSIEIAVIPTDVENAARYIEKALAAYAENDVVQAELMLLSAHMWVQQAVDRIV